MIGSGKRESTSSVAYPTSESTPDMAISLVFVAKKYHYPA